MNTLQRTRSFGSILAVLALVVVGCATAPPELVTARETFAVAEKSTAPQHAPAEMKIAAEALARAEEAFEELGPKNETTRTFAYVATRKAELAVVLGQTYVSKQEKELEDESLLTQNKSARDNLSARLEASSDLAAMTSKQLREEREKLELAKAEVEKGEMTKDELAAERIRIAKLTEKLDAERTAREKLEADLAKTRAELKKVASIKEEPNRMTITLNGSVLFDTGEFQVRSAATHRLDQVADMLLAERDATITVIGYTDSEGSSSNNQTLSENRASSVRNYLLTRGVAEDRITSKGLGESSPLSTNKTATGRANNRRVEIVVDRNLSASR